MSFDFCSSCSLWLALPSTLYSIHSDEVQRSQTKAERLSREHDNNKCALIYTGLHPSIPNKPKLPHWKQQIKVQYVKCNSDMFVTPKSLGAQRGAETFRLIIDLSDVEQFQHIRQQKTSFSELFLWQMSTRDIKVNCAILYLDIYTTKPVKNVDNTCFILPLWHYLYNYCMSLNCHYENANLILVKKH